MTDIRSDRRETKILFSRRTALGSKEVDGEREGQSRYDRKVFPTFRKKEKCKVPELYATTKSDFTRKKQKVSVPDRDKGSSLTSPY